MLCGSGIYTIALLVALISLLFTTNYVEEILVLIVIGVLIHNIKHASDADDIDVRERMKFVEVNSTSLFALSVAVGSMALHANNIRALTLLGIGLMLTILIQMIVWRMNDNLDTLVHIKTALSLFAGALIMGSIGGSLLTFSKRGYITK